MVTSSTLRRAFAGIALIVSALLAGCSPSPTRAAAVSDGNRKTAPDFTLTDVSGRPVKLSDYKGKVVLLNFWATWCGPCKTEIPWFNQFEKTYKDRGFEILGVSMDENGWRPVRPFVKQMEVKYPVMIGNDGVAQLYGGIESLPMTFLIDREGRVAEVHSGLVDKHQYQDEILRLIAR
jgi:peroxiredoxin